jgi:effector-binding domain-containing protein/uncharacterized protein YndB with AHSA1/START domain
MKFLKKLIYSILITAAIIAIILLFIPRDYTVARSIVIDAPVAVTYDLVENTSNWNKWSPLYSFENEITINEFETKSGYGSGLAWKSNNESKYTNFIKCENVIPNQLLNYNLSLNNSSKAAVKFVFEDSDDKTKVICTLEGKLEYPFNFLKFFKEKFFSSFIEDALEKLKQESESAGKINIQISTTNVPDQKLFAIRDTVTGNNFEALSIALGTAYTELFEFFNPKKNLQLAGPPIEIIIETEPDYLFDAAIPVIAPDNIVPTGRIRITKLNGGKVVKAVYKGSYDRFRIVFKIIDSYILRHNLTKIGKPWLEYVNDPVRTPPEELITNIYIPVK